MRNTIAVITITALAAVAPAIANASKEENVGVGTGAVIGAIAGGPVGLILGAAIGSKVGDTMYQKNAEIDTLSASLDTSRSRVAALNTNIETLSLEIGRLQDTARPELVRLLQAGITMDLLFRTDEHVLTDTTGGRLAELAGVLADMPDVRIELSGFADERGDETYNFELSQQRVEFVRDQLMAVGISQERISANAFGEAPAQDDTPDSYALERRVNMTVFIDDSPSFAAQ